MTAVADTPSGIAACGCLTPLGDAEATLAALLAGKVALQLQPVFGRDGGDLVPLAILGAMDESVPPRWLPDLRRLVETIPAAAAKWGAPRTPVVVTSSNFGVGSLYAFM